MAKNLDPITRLSQACNPTLPLEPGDDRYVDCEGVRGSGFLEECVRSFQRASPAEPIVRGFAGHIGVGKSTEMLRLKERLEDVGFKVIYLDVSDRETGLDCNDLDLPDLLTFIAGEAAKQLSKIGRQLGITVQSTLFDSLWKQLCEYLSGKKLVLKFKEIKAPYLPLAIEIKNRPSARAALRNAIEAHSTSLLDALRDLLTIATVELRAKGLLGLVVLCDGTEKVPRRHLADHGMTTHERLFVNRAPQLAGLGVHVVYSLPISLIYDPAFTQTVQTFGDPCPPLPMVRLRSDDHGHVTPDTPGMKTMWRMVEARCRYAGVDVTEAFDRPETAQYLCEMSGGHPRHLVMFLRSAANALDALPITREAADKAVRDYANGLLRALPEDYWDRLRKFAGPTNDLPKDEPHLQMLLWLYIYEYMNDNVWYEVNPVLRTLAKFNQAD